MKSLIVMGIVLAMIFIASPVTAIEDKDTTNAWLFNRMQTDLAQGTWIFKTINASEINTIQLNSVYHNVSHINVTGEMNVSGDVNIGGNLNVTGIITSPYLNGSFVPYTGANKNVDIGGYKLDAGTTYQATIGDDTNTRAGYFTDGTRTATITDGTNAGRFVNGAIYANLAGTDGGVFHGTSGGTFDATIAGFSGGFFTDGTRSANIAYSQAGGYFTDGTRHANIAGYNGAIESHDATDEFYALTTSYGFLSDITDGSKIGGRVTDGSDIVDFVNGTYAIVATGDSRFNDDIIMDNSRLYDNGNATFGGDVQIDGTVQAEHLYTTDDAVIDDDLTVNGLYNIVATTATEGQIVQGGTRIFHTFTPSQQAPTYPNVFIGENAGSFIMDNTGGAYQGTGNVGIGEDALTALTTGYYNFVFGSGAGKSITEGHSNFIAGHAAGDKITTGDYNILFGRSAGLSLTTQNRNVGIGTEVIDSMTGGGDNVVIGHGAGNTATSMTSNVLLGFYAGHYQAGTSNYKLIIDGIARADAATELTDSLIYGVFNSAVDSQSITFNVGTASFGAGNITTTGLGTLGSLVVDSTTLVVNADGHKNQVSIGTATPASTCSLYVYAASQTLSSRQQVQIESSSAMDADRGGGIGFGGKYLSGSDNTAMWASLAGRKENSISGNVRGYFQFGTRATSGNTREVMRLDSDGNMLMSIGGNITTTGNITASYLNATENVFYNVTKEIEINPSRFKLPGVNPPLEQLVGDFPVLSFDKNTNETAYTSMHIFPEYRDGSNWKVAIYWAPNDAGAGDIVWCINVTRLDAEDNDLLTITGISYCTTDSTQTLTNELLKSPKINIPGSAYGKDDEVSFKIYRGASAPADTYDDDAHLVEATIYYNAWKLGD